MAMDVHVLFACPEREEYKILSLGMCDNERIKDIAERYYLFPAAILIPKLKKIISCIETKLHDGLWHVLNEKYEQGYRYLTPDIKDESDQNCYMSKWDREDYFFPLENRWYDIEDLLFKGCAPVNINSWLGFSKFCRDYKDKYHTNNKEFFIWHWNGEFELGELVTESDYNKDFSN